MVPITVHTLVVSTAPTPSVLVLQPLEEQGCEKHSRIVPIWIGPNEATQIGLSLEKTKFSRPITHDLLLDVLTNLDAQIDHVLIYKVQGSTFYAYLYLKQHDRVIQLDSRPSDAIALALRQQAPLFMSEEVLEKASFPYSLKRKPHENIPEEELNDFKKFLEKISPGDFT